MIQWGSVMSGLLIWHMWSREPCITGAPSLQMPASLSYERPLLGQKLPKCWKPLTWTQCFSEKCFFFCGSIIPKLRIYEQLTALSLNSVIIALNFKKSMLRMSALIFPLTFKTRSPVILTVTKHCLLWFHIEVSVRRRNPWCSLGAQNIVPASL
jgi:hypothetical protein